MIIVYYIFCYHIIGAVVARIFYWFIQDFITYNDYETGFYLFILIWPMILCVLVLFCFYILLYKIVFFGKSENSS